MLQYTPSEEIVVLMSDGPIITQRPAGYARVLKGYGHTVREGDKFLVPCDRTWRDVDWYAIGKPTDGFVCLIRPIYGHIKNQVTIE